MTSVSEKELREVNGGSAGSFRKGISAKDAVSYLQLLSERPGIIDRLEANTLTDEDCDSIDKYFSSENRFLRVAQFAHSRSIEEIQAIAAMND